MEFVFPIKFVLLAIALVIVALIARHARKRPNRAKGRPERIRMPKVVGIVGWLVLGGGALMAMAAFGSYGASDPLPMRIGSIALTLGGALFVLMYANWYVSPGPDEMAYRTVFGNERVIRYSDIVDYRFTDQRGQRMLSLKTSDGKKLTLSSTIYDLSPLLAHIAFREKNGRWPLRGELRSAVR